MTSYLACTALTLVAYCALILVYRLYLHPLAKFPGPKLAAATSWYLAYHDIWVAPGAQVMFELRRLHHIYGPVIRISPDELHVDDYTWVDTLYTVTANGVRDKHPPDAMMVGKPHSIFGTVSHIIHRKRRAAFAHLFSKANTAGAEAMIWDKADKMVNNIDRQIQRDGFADLRTHTLAMTTDVAAEYCLEESLHLQDDEHKAQQWCEIQTSVPSMIPIARHFNWIMPLSQSLPPSIVAELNPMMSQVLAVKVEAERQAKAAIKAFQLSGDKAPPEDLPHQKHNIFRTIVTSEKIPDTDKGSERMADEAWGILVAGGDTTAKVLANLMFFLCQNRSTILEKLRKELKKVTHDGEIRPPLRELQHVPLLTAVLKETLRTHGPLTSRLPRVSPREDLKYKSWTIPAGACVSMSPGDLSNNEQIFENPYEWRPERWLIDDHEKLDVMNRAFIPFGRGTRMCVGQNLAWVEMYIGAAAIIQRLDLDIFDTVRARDVDFTRDCLVGQSVKGSKGVRVKHLAK
ncbi:cytochrome protein [Sarocladium strictum]